MSSGAPGGEFDRGVRAEIARLARDLHSHQVGEARADDLLAEVTTSAVGMLPGVHHAGATLHEGRGRRVRSLAATGPIPGRVDALQEMHRDTVRVDDYHSDTRWPRFAAEVLATTPVRSSVSIQLYTNETELGALNLYPEDTYAITPVVEEHAVALAAHAAVGLADARLIDQYQSALANRDTIGQAKGIIMERFDIDAAAAFGLLTRLPQEKNVRLAEIDRRLVADRRPE